MNTPEDVQKLKQAKELILDVAKRVDCNYCKSHLFLIADLIDDATDITKFNLLYENDEKALENLRKILTEETTLRILSLASKIVGFFRLFKLRKKFI